jgi:DNA-binding NtrC family response regulator
MQKRKRLYERAFTGSPVRRLLVASSDRLLRWSLCTYLRDWFDVQAVSDVSAAEQVLHNGDFDALFLSDDLPVVDMDRIEMLTKSMNPKAIVVHTTTNPTAARITAPNVVQLEKPFDLAALARVLGVPDSSLRCAPPEDPSSEGTQPL